MGDNIPDKIIVHYEFSPRSDFYALEFPDRFDVQRIDLEGIYQFFEETDQDDWKDYKVVYWVPTQHGHHVEWRIDGQNFMELAETVTIDERYSDRPYRDPRPAKVLIF